jgi:hypothetical protein
LRARHRAKLEVLLTLENNQKILSYCKARVADLLRAEPGRD